MLLVGLIAEGVGPFKSLELDLSNGKGEPHLGPHILAGVNGSGKSTILRAIAWVFDRGHSGFPHDEWQQRPRGYETSRIALHEFESGSGRLPCRRIERSKGLPKRRRRATVQSGVELPSLWSRNAFPASASHLPAATSASNSSSQTRSS